MDKSGVSVRSSNEQAIKLATWRQEMKGMMKKPNCFVLSV